jgi:hypothetical protein
MPIVVLKWSENSIASQVYCAISEKLFVVRFALPQQALRWHSMLKKELEREHAELR